MAPLRRRTQGLAFPSMTVDLSRPVLMGVINVTPDSFSDGGQFLDPDAAVAHGHPSCARDGAAMLDVGGESTRPGAEPVGVEEELRRVVPVSRASRPTRPGGLRDVGGHDQARPWPSRARRPGRRS